MVSFTFFSVESCIVDTFKNCLYEPILMNTTIQVLMEKEEKNKNANNFPLPQQN